MNKLATISKSLKASVVGITVIALTLFGVTPALAANFTATSAATNTAGSQILLHTSVAIDPVNSAKVPANFTVTVNGTVRASTTYSVGFAANDVVLTLTSGTLTYTDTITVAYARSGNNKIVQQGANNNTLSNTSSPLAVTNNVTIPDTTPPTFTAMTANTAGTNITITYNEDLLTSSVPAATAFTITQDGATISNTSYTVAVATRTVTLSFGSATIVNNSTVRLSYAVPGTGQIKDAAGNSAAAITNNLVANPVPDTTAPRVVGRSTNEAGTVVSIFFNELLSTTNVPLPADFNLSVNSVRYSSSDISVAVSGSQVNLTLTGSPVVFGDAVLITYTHNADPAKQIQDVAHNIGNSTDNEIVTNATLDLGAPVLDGRQTNLTGDEIRVNYLTPLLTSSVPAASDYTLNINGSTYSPFTASISGNDVVLTLTGLPVPFGAIVTLSYSGTAVKRASNSISAASFANVTVDNRVVPEAAPYAENGQTSVDGSYIYINMSKPLYSSAVPAASDFTVEFDSAPYTGSFTVSVAGSVVTLHLTTPASQNTYVEVAYSPNADSAKRLKDLAGNEAASWIDLDVTNLMPDTLAPYVVSRVTNTTGTQIIITFSEQLCETCLPLSSDLYLLFDGTRYDSANYTMSISGATYTFTLTGAPITFGQTIRLSYVPNAIIAKRVQDKAGNQLPPTNNAVITNLVPSSGAPSVTSKSINPAGTAVTIAYDIALDATSVPAAGEYALRVNGSSYVGGFTVAISGSSVTLTLGGSAITAGSTTTLSYTGTSVKASVGGVAAPQFTDNEVTSFVRPELVTLATDSVNGRQIYLTFNVPLNASSVPSSSDFTLTVNGVVYSAANYTVSVTGSSVVLDLQLTGAAIKQTEVVRLIYTPGGAPIEDTNGNDAAALPLTVVSNRVPDLTAPENISLVTDLIGSQIIWTYNEPLAPAHVPLPSDVIVTVDGVTYSNSNYTIGVDDSRMVVRLNGNRIRFGQIVVLTYIPGLMNNRLADPAGNIVQDEPHATVLNLVSSNAIPTVSSMVTNTAGNQISINFNKTLDATSVPLSGDFIVSLNDAIINSATVSVAVSGSTVTLTLSSNTIANGIRVDVLYAAGLNKIQDLAGNFADGFEKTRVTNLVPDTTAPTVISRVSNAAGDKIIITFSEPLNAARLPLVSDIALVFDGVRYDPANYTMSIVGSVFTFTLTGPKIRFGQTLRLSYTRNLSDSNLWVQDLAGNLVNNSVSQSVDNLVPDTAVPLVTSAQTSILGDKITLTFNQALDAGGVPSLSHLTLHVGGSIYSSSNITTAVSGTTVVLTLTGDPIAHGQPVSLTYSGDEIRRSNGIQAAVFANLTVVNAVPDTTAPVVLLRDEITVHLGDTALTTATADDEVTWSEAIDDSGYFAIDSNTGAITVSSSAVVGTYEYTVTATNDAGIQTDATILIMVRPVPIVASIGGDRVLAAPLPPVATSLAPVIGVTTTVAETKVVASIDTYFGYRTVSVLEPVGGVPAGATIAIKPGPVADESADGRFTIQIDVTSPTGTDINEFQKIFTINMGAFVSGTIPAHSSDGINWPALPKLQGDWLPAGNHDGYFIDSLGNLIILTRHMTYFGLKKDQELVHDLRILTGPTRMVVGGEFVFKVSGGLGAGRVTVENLTPELCSIQPDFSVHALKAGTCQIRTTKLGDGVYANAESDVTNLLIENPSARMRVYGSIKLLRVDLGSKYAGKTVSILMSTPAVHPFTLYRKVTLDEMGVKELRIGFDSHATFRVLDGKKIVVDAKAND
jgi:uncharacterized repeat protein (TIGR02059 family)